MKKILVICPFPYDVAAGQRLKYEQYFDHWRENGYEITMSAFLDMETWNIVYKPGNFIAKVIGTFRGYFRRLRDVFRVGRYDMVYVFMWVTPFGTSFFERLFRILSKKLIYDIEDNVLLEKSNDINPFVKLLKSANKIEHLIKTADHVITSSPFLNDHCLNINESKSCTYISSSIDTNRFIPKNSYVNDHKIVIGWTGTFSSRCYLDLLHNVFIKLNECCDFRLKVIGNFEYEFPGIDLEVVQWSKEKEVDEMQDIDIGVYPLDLSEWVLGKSGLKAIQYMSFGIPPVATNVGTTPMVINHLENGWLVKTEDEWVNALKTLVNDPKLRSRLGRSARETVLNRYSKNVIGLQYLSILNRVSKVN